MLINCDNRIDAHLSILKCPITHEPLRLAKEHEIIALSEEGARAEGTAEAVSVVGNKVSSALVSQNGQFAYPVQDGIIILLPERAVGLATSDGVSTLLMRPEKADVQSFYDEIGWQKSSDGVYVDAQRFEDMRPVSQPYIHNCHLRVKRHVNAEGTYLLDAASGPIQYPEYLSYSENFQTRICVDLSLSALRDAKQKLGDKGLYLLADITRLPLQDNSIDAAVSLHTIYHVPQDEQITAFREIHRVLKPGSSAVIVYSRGSEAPLMKVAFPISTISGLLGRAKQSLKKVVKRALKRPTPSSLPVPPTVGPKLYFHAARYSQLLDQLRDMNFEIVVWRSVSVAFLKRYVQPGMVGRRLIQLLNWFEDRFPHIAGKVGQYPMFVFRK